MPTIEKYVLVRFIKSDCPSGDRGMIGDAWSTRYGMLVDGGIYHGEVAVDGGGRGGRRDLEGKYLISKISRRSIAAKKVLNQAK